MDKSVALGSAQGVTVAMLFQKALQKEIGRTCLWPSGILGDASIHSSIHPSIRRFSWFSPKFPAGRGNFGKNQEKPGKSRKTTEKPGKT